MSDRPLRRPDSDSTIAPLASYVPAKRDDVLRDRSALYWPELITVPTLILQGTADWRASPMETLALAEKLQQAGTTYELIMYAGDDHGLSVNRVDSSRRIPEWFRRHFR
jgi:dipeptidyl aminopeptidase/acylaminoacyl peptidase